MDWRSSRVGVVGLRADRLTLFQLSLSPDNRLMQIG